MIADLFRFGDYWESAAAVTPPPFFDEDAGFMLSTDSAAAGDRAMSFVGDVALLPGDYSVSLQVTGNPLQQNLALVILIDVAPFTIVMDIGSELGTTTSTFTVPAGVGAFNIAVSALVGMAYVAPSYFDGVILPQVAGLNAPVLVNGGSSDYDRTLCYDAPVDYDSGRFMDPRARTLSAIRNDIVVRLGYSANTVLPPGMQALVDSFINDANEQLYERYPVMRLMRWWTWQTQVGQKFYDVPIDCTKYLDTRHIVGAWLQDDDAWFPLVAGINPLLFNQVYLSLPQYYEVRERLELWPVPDKPSYLFHIKGQIGPAPMVADDDTCTVDARPVFLFALANAKAHYQQPDATRYDRQLEIMIGKLTGGSHYSKRYIPNQPPAVGLPLPIRQVPGG